MKLKAIIHDAEEGGFRAEVPALARINGSHHVYVKNGRMERLVIPIHGNDSLKTGLQRALMKLVPLRDEEL